MKKTSSKSSKNNCLNKTHSLSTEWPSQTALAVKLMHVTLKDISDRDWISNSRILKYTVLFLFCSWYEWDISSSMYGFKEKMVCTYWKERSNDDSRHSRGLDLSHQSLSHSFLTTFSVLFPSCSLIPFLSFLPPTLPCCYVCSMYILHTWHHPSHLASNPLLLTLLFLKHTPKNIVFDIKATSTRGKEEKCWRQTCMGRSLRHHLQQIHNLHDLEQAF